ncbi:hypothetical protein Cni_G27436 [Canna indica]|uniref:Stress response NST1-like protein n=1 Tax=Canna indica TaxID=4628 RepID=A0AAQ3L1R7_9LILI|nr:hypothetical protein Cni_G27436 [Canna indica]
MCILCVVQRWSRRVATLLPWLLIPLLIFWAMSPFLPQGLRFEITSPRLACVLVLLVTLFWYEVLMPSLSRWRASRSARIWERRRALAIEMQKLRKTATRRCRNCHTPYRDQNPGGGRFMCSYCGHVSKRPVLDLPRSVGEAMINDLGKHGWNCSQDWTAEGNKNWANSPPQYWVTDDHYSMEKSCSGVVFFARKLLFCFISSMRWICRKVFRVSLGEDDSDGGHRGSSSKRGDNGGNLQESKWEKARRKAEEKRQAKLEKEMLEEEERKQREEVARLVEERRKLRDEMLKTEREHSKGSDTDGERANRKIAEKGRQDRRKDRDKGSSKSNSDVEDPEKKNHRETERKHEFDKKNDHEKRDASKTITEIPKSHSLGNSHGTKVTASKPRYFARMTGNLLSSSRGFGSASFFGRNLQNPTTAVNKVSKPTTGFMDHVSENKKDFQVTGDKLVKAAPNGDDRGQGINIHQPGSSFYPKRQATPVKSWHHLFTGISSCQNGNGQQEARSSHFVDQRLPPNHAFSEKMINGKPLPSNARTTACESFNSSSFPSLSAEFPSVKDPVTRSIVEEAEVFEDPCYVPDPISLLGPVSEALDNFPLDLGAGFLSSDKVEEPQLLKNVPGHGSIAKPSPIESPISRMRVPEKQTFGQVSCTSKSLDSNTLNLGGSQGTWQMWGAPSSQDNLGLVGGPSNWFLPLGQKNLRQEDDLDRTSHNSITSQSVNESPTLLGIQSPQHVYDINQQDGGSYSPHGAGINDGNHWMQKLPLQTLPVDGESHFLPLNLIDNIQQTDKISDCRNTSMDDSPYELPPANSWFSSPPSVARNEWGSKVPQQYGSSALAKPNIGGLFSTSADTESVWSFSQKESK